MTPTTEERADRERWLYYHELRIDRMSDKYCRAVIHGDSNSSIVIELRKRLADLEAETFESTDQEIGCAPTK